MIHIVLLKYYTDGTITIGGASQRKNTNRLTLTSELALRNTKLVINQRSGYSELQSSKNLLRWRTTEVDPRRPSSPPKHHLRRNLRPALIGFISKTSSSPGHSPAKATCTTLSSATALHQTSSHDVCVGSQRQIGSVMIARATERG